MSGDAAPTGTTVVPPRTDPATNGLAVAAFVVAFFWGLLGLVLAIVARRQIRRDGTRGDGLAVAAIVVGALRLVLEIALGAYLVAGLVTGSSDQAEGSRSSDPLADGTCFVAAGSSVACAEPHGAEILGRVPGLLNSEEGRVQAETACRELVASFAIDESKLGAHEADMIPLGDSSGTMGACVVTFGGDVVTGSVLVGTAAAAP